MIVQYLKSVTVADLVNQQTTADRIFDVIA
jgi:hypothetical protein